MKPVVKLSVKSDSSKNVKDQLRQLARSQVLVGWPQESSSRPGEAVTNAELAYIHTHGSPAKNIPARPILEPALSTTETKRAILGELERAAEAALKGDFKKMLSFLQRAGQEAENAARAWFTDGRNAWAENKPATIARKGSDRPLIDTGELRKALTHVVVSEE